MLLYMSQIGGSSLGRPALKLKVMLSKPEKENNHEKYYLSFSFDAVRLYGDSW